MCEPNTVPDRSEVISCADIASEMQQTLKKLLYQLTAAGRSQLRKKKFTSEYVILYVKDLYT